MSDVCLRVGKWFRGCRWQGRYDRVSPSSALEQRAVRDWQLPLAAWEQLQHRVTYVRDVCRTCGDVRERAAPD